MFYASVSVTTLLLGILIVVFPESSAPYQQVYLPLIERPGTSTTTSTTTTTVPAPLDIILSIPPTIYLTGQTQTFELIGTGFVDGMTIYIGGLDIYPVSVSSPTRGTFTIPGQHLGADAFGGNNPQNLAAYLIYRFSTSDYFFFGLKGSKP